MRYGLSRGSHSVRKQVFPICFHLTHNQGVTGSSPVGPTETAAVGLYDEALALFAGAFLLSRYPVMDKKTIFLLTDIYRTAPRQLQVGLHCSRFVPIFAGGDK